MIRTLIIFLLMSTSPLSAQINFVKVGEKIFPVFKSEKGIKPEWWGFKYGTDLTESVQRNNFTAFKQACNYAVLNKTHVIIPSDSVEIYLPKDSTINVSDGDVLDIRSYSKSYLTIYPRVKVYNNGVHILFTCSGNGSIRLSNIELFTQPFRLETYSITLSPSGQTNKVIVHGTKRAGFLTDIVGQTIFLTVGYTQTQATTATVLSVTDSTITLAGTTSYSSNQPGQIGFPFSSSQTTNNISTYGQFWYGSNTGSMLLNLVSSPATNDSTHWSFRNVKISGFDFAIQNSGGKQKIEFIDCDLSADQILLGYFNTSIPGRTIYFENTQIHGIGKNVYGYLPNNTLVSGQVYGAGVYSHDNVTHELVNCQIYENLAAAIRQRSSDGIDSTYSNQVSKYVNCAWWDNAEYHIFTSRTMPSVFTNCSFEGGNINAMWETYLNNCILIDCNIGRAGTAEVKTRLNMVGGELKGTSISMQGQEKIYLDNVIITSILNSSTISCGGVQDFKMSNCTVKDNPASTATYFFDTVLPLKGTFENCYLGYLGETKYFHRTAYDLNYTDTILIHDIININDCEIYGNFWSSSQLSVSGAGRSTNTKYFATVNSFQNCWDDFTPAPGLSYEIITAENNDYGSGAALTWELSPNFNTFYVSDSVTRAYFYTGGISRQFSGNITLIVSDTAKVTAFNSSSNTGSNFMFSGTYSNEDVVNVFFDPRKILASGTASVTNDTILTANGTSTKYQNWDGLSSNKIVPGTVQIVCGGVTLNDDNAGNLIGSGGYGYVDYETRNVLIIFNTPPASGTKAIASYDEYATVYNRGAFYKRN